MESMTLLYARRPMRASSGIYRERQRQDHASKVMQCFMRKVRYILPRASKRLAAILDRMDILSDPIKASPDERTSPAVPWLPRMVRLRPMPASQPTNPALEE
jgi:hypothetical protein